MSNSGHLALRKCKRKETVSNPNSLCSRFRKMLHLREMLCQSRTVNVWKGKSAKSPSALPNYQERINCHVADVLVHLKAKLSIIYSVSLISILAWLLLVGLKCWSIQLPQHTVDTPTLWIGKVSSRAASSHEKVLDNCG